MSKIICPGYFPPGTGAEDEELLYENFGLIVQSAATILRLPEMYFCSPQSCWLSAAYIAGGPLCLGFLLEGYRAQALLQLCPECLEPAYIFRLGGSPLSGANFSSVFCTRCQVVAKIQNAPGFLDRLSFILNLRRDKKSLWQEVTGTESSLEDLVKKLSEQSV